MRVMTPQREQSAFGEYAQLHEILAEMHRLFVKHDVGQQAYTLRALDAIGSREAEAIAASLNGLEFWGGAGSVLDIILFEIPWTAEFRRDVPDDDRLKVLRAELLRVMERLGIAEPWVIARAR
jgi:hypothetical protein